MIHILGVVGTPLHPCLLWGAEQGVTGRNVMHMTGYISLSTQDPG